MLVQCRPLYHKPLLCTLLNVVAEVFFSKRPDAHSYFLTSILASYHFISYFFYPRLRMWPISFFYNHFFLRSSSGAISIFSPIFIFKTLPLKLPLSRENTLLCWFLKCYVLTLSISLSPVIKISLFIFLCRVTPARRGIDYFSSGAKSKGVRSN